MRRASSAFRNDYCLVQRLGRACLFFSFAGFRETAFLVGLAGSLPRLASLGLATALASSSALRAPPPASPLRRPCAAGRYARIPRGCASSRCGAARPRRARAQASPLHRHSASRAWPCGHVRPLWVSPLRGDADLGIALGWFLGEPFRDFVSDRLATSLDRATSSQDEYDCACRCAREAHRENLVPHTCTPGGGMRTRAVAGTPTHPATLTPVA